MNCHIHNQNQPIAKCRKCKQPICEQCADIHKKYGACPSCSKDKLFSLYSSFKKGLVFNVLSVLCAIAFFVCYAIDVSAGQADKLYVILGAIFGSIIAIFSITMLIKTALKIKNLGKIIKDIE